MPSKQNSAKLAKAQEEKRRSKFLNQRQECMGAELAFARGEIAALPHGFKRPPKLVLAAIKLAWKTGFPHLEKLRPKGAKKYSLGDYWELSAMLRGFTSELVNPQGNILEDERQAPALAALRRAAATKISKKQLRSVSRAEAAFHNGPPMPSPAQLKEHASRTKIGLKNSISEDGKIAEVQTMTAQIYFLLWQFWPSIKGRLSAPEIHRWLVSDQSLKPSDKLVEAAVTSLRREARKL